MTTTAIASDFTAAGVAQQVVAVHTAARRGTVDAKLDAKLDDVLDPNQMPSPDLLWLALQIWVTYGFLTKEQAHALLKALTGGTFVDLPPLPVPEGTTLLLPLYAMTRGAIIAKTNTVDVSIDDLIAVGHSLVEALSLIPDIVNGIEAAGSAIYGFFSSLFS